MSQPIPHSYSTPSHQNLQRQWRQLSLQSIQRRAISSPILSTCRANSFEGYPSLRIGSGNVVEGRRASLGSLTRVVPDSTCEANRSSDLDRCEPMGDDQLPSYQQVLQQICDDRANRSDIIRRTTQHSSSRSSFHPQPDSTNSTLQETSIPPNIPTKPTLFHISNLNHPTIPFPSSNLPPSSPSNQNQRLRSISEPALPTTLTIPTNLQFRTTTTTRTRTTRRRPQGPRKPMILREPSNTPSHSFGLDSSINKMMDLNSCFGYKHLHVSPFLSKTTSNKVLRESTPPVTLKKSRPEIFWLPLHKNDDDDFFKRYKALHVSPIPFKPSTTTTTTSSSSSSSPNLNKKKTCSLVQNISKNENIQRRRKSLTERLNNRKKVLIGNAINKNSIEDHDDHNHSSSSSSSLNLKKCKICNSFFCSQSILQRHIALVHSHHSNQKSSYFT
ncbi:hypothetical protein CROQUDRAFT_133212 [Cronartium quercuum f. sp. fusiforme G11]|uniref:C2H2-type domain-containing protein n=1 Tax=Cronartium quercuum f. sp. fusiforme G11 TaxID=708437 RepID=A0A9P6NMM1_9BASI|nr:hypothetical protein CROQUDRAFT_133212 [Cronartium quercuum f. sp. fusiforme G11]